MKRKKEENMSITKKPNTLIIIVSISLILLAIFAGVMGIIALVRESTSVVSFRGVYVDEGVASFLASTFKYSYMDGLDDVGIDVYDDEIFWQTEMEPGVTYGDMLREETENYIRGIVVGTYLYNMAKSLSSDEQAFLRKNTTEILDYRAEGDKNKFNSLSREMGFDYDDFVVGSEMMYKAVAAKNVLYGIDGSTLQSGGYYGDTNLYFETFSRVRMLFIRTKNDFIISDGEFVRDAGGNYETYELSSEEIKAREDDISEIRAAIRAYENDGDGQMSPEFFATMQEKYNLYDDFKSSGYYFSVSSEYTVGFANEIGTEITDAIFELGVNEYQEIEYADGICFIYKMELDPYAYLNPDYEVFFSDFFADASKFLFSKNLNESMQLVTVKDGYYNINVEALPYNGEFIIRDTN